jgi:peptidoglycan-N-acetylglucosamine deacetylase
LTFDDGPDPTWTPAVLDALRAERAKATFFPIAPRAARQPELVARIVDEGHTIGLHCDEHVRHSQRSAAWLVADTDLALARLARLGVAPRLWRTPWGQEAPWTARIAAERRLTLTGWTVDSQDWRGDDARTLFERARDGLVDGAIVLAHDGIGPGALRTDCEQTVAFVAAAADLARSRGLALAPIDPDTVAGRRP